MRILRRIFFYFSVCPVSLQRLIGPLSLTGLINYHWQTSEFV